MMTSPPRAADPKDNNARFAAAHERAMRGWTEFLQVWRLCDNGACRRERACRGLARPCMKARFPLLPEGVRIWFEELLAAQCAKVPFEQAFEHLETIGANKALAEWFAAEEAGAEAPGALHAPAPTGSWKET